jgi:ribosomal protein S7
MIAKKFNKKKYLVSTFVGSLIKSGNRTRAVNILQRFLFDIEYAYNVNSIDFLLRLFENIRPKTFLIPKRVAGSTIRIPSPISTQRSYSIAIKWFLSSVSKRSGEPFNHLIMYELMDIYSNPTNLTLKKRDEYHKLALLNRPFLRYNRF